MEAVDVTTAADTECEEQGPSVPCIASERASASTLGHLPNPDPAAGTIVRRTIKKGAAMQPPRENPESQQATERPGGEGSDRGATSGGRRANDPEVPNVTAELQQPPELPRQGADRPPAAGGSGASIPLTATDAAAPVKVPAASPTPYSGPAAVDEIEIGREVAAVLKAAEAAAQRMRANAERDSEVIRADARDAAERLLADAQREGQALRAELQELRREVDAYAKRVRADAEGYAAATRKSAEEDANNKSTEAEHVLRTARREAAKIIKDATRDGEGRKAALEVEAARFEERFANVLTIFQDMSSQLEGVLRRDRQPDEQPAGDSASKGESLAQELTDAATAKREEAGPSSAVGGSSSRSRSGARGKGGR